MRRTLLAGLGAALALCIWAGTAAADTGSAAAMTPAGGTAPTDPTLDAFGLVAQHVPEFGAEPAPAAGPTEASAPEAASDAAPAPAEGGGTSQANGSLGGSLAANGNETGQVVDQAQGSPAAPTTAVPAPKDEDAKLVPAAPATQVAGQSADSTQTADATATSTQIEPTNQSIAVRVLSPGDNGPVTQSNDSAALAGALNGNSTSQSIGQIQGGPGSGGTQAAGQAAKSDQSAIADASAKQIKPSNQNISVRILSPGDDGDVSQSNTNVAGALAANGNETGQAIDQSQGAGGGTQVAGQKADNEQAAEANAEAVQVKPENTNISVRILSPGSNGAVSQSNTNGAGALAANVNATCQCITQQQAGGPGAGGSQIAGQSASNHQDAYADADAKQIAPRNENISVRVLSPGADGPVSQSNTNLALSGALNANATTQNIGQSGGGMQVAGQKAWSGQDATAYADAEQVNPSNLNAPVRVLSPGGDGPVEQSNTTLAGSLSANLNHTDQGIGQSGGGAHGGTAVQAAGQLAGNRQSADSDATATQCCATNVNAPVAVKSRGGGGAVEQSNDAVALSGALNLNGTGQWIGQRQAGSGGTAIQAAGQKASNRQDAVAHADALQVHPRNVNAGARVLDGRKQDCRDRCGHDADGKPESRQRDACEGYEGCKLRQPCVHESGCKPRQPDRRERCRTDEPRKRLEPCPAQARCRPAEPKDRCGGYPEPRTPERRLMPMS